MVWTARKALSSYPADGMLSIIFVNPRAYGSVTLDMQEANSPAEVVSDLHPNSEYNAAQIDKLEGLVGCTIAFSRCWIIPSTSISPAFAARSR